MKQSVTGQKLSTEQPTAIVIFGGTGDLAATKLLPALLDLYCNQTLPPAFVIIGLSRKEFSDADYQAYVKNIFTATKHNASEETLQAFCSHLRYVQGAFDDARSYDRIKTVLTNYDAEIAQCTNKLFYLAVPPDYYQTIFTHLSESNVMSLCDEENSWARLLVEKPFGRDLDTATKLEEQLCRLFTDEQIYRIDHYLAKDAIENIISLRFANSFLADSWNKNSIESITVRLVETKDVANRGSFYDGIGTLRDVGQNHILQIIALLTMGAVDVRNAQSVRTARASALAQLLCQVPDQVVRGQYAGFTETTGVAPASQTETYFKVSFVSESEAWQGVRFTLEAGKGLAETKNEAILTFRAFDDCECSSTPELHGHHNVLKIQFSPEQKISLRLWTKKPGFTFALQEQELELMHDTASDTHSPEAYVRVLFDCLAGDQTRFVSSAEVDASWKFITPILEMFPSVPLQTYPVGSRGPHENL